EAKIGTELEQRITTIELALAKANLNLGIAVQGGMPVMPGHEDVIMPAKLLSARSQPSELPSPGDGDNGGGPSVNGRRNATASPRSPLGCPVGMPCSRSRAVYRPTPPRKPTRAPLLWSPAPNRRRAPRRRKPLAESSRRDRVMAKHIEELGQFLQSFGVAPLALLLLPVLITALARNVTLVLATSLLSFTSLMLFVAPASATSGLAIVSGLGSFLVALESILARGRMKEIADLTSRVNDLERAEQRRLSLEIKASD